MFSQMRRRRSKRKGEETKPITTKTFQELNLRSNVRPVAELATSEESVERQTRREKPLIQ